MTTTTKACNSQPPLDKISELPINITNKILMHLSLKEAIQTSILSSKWRYKWLSLPHLVFSYRFNHNKLDKQEKTNLVIAVYQALLLHRGPLHKFSFSVPNFDNSNNDMSHWIHFLSNTDIQDLTLRFWTGDHQKMPCPLYSLQHLKQLNLYNCVFKTPPTFKGFDKLVSLELKKVVFAAERFGIFVSNCPLLERLVLDECPHFFCFRISAPNLKNLSFRGSFDSVNLKNTSVLEVVSIALIGMAEHRKYSKDRKSSKLIEIISCIPAIEKFSAELCFMKFLAKGKTQERLPRTLVHLRIIHLAEICFSRAEEVSCALCLIRSSPNLEELTITGNTNTNENAVMEPAVLEYLRKQEFSDCSLKKLKEAKMQFISGIQQELEFMKFLLSTSTRLEKLEVLPAKDKINSSSGFQILRELIRFRRASAKAEIIYLDPDEENDY